MLKKPKLPELNLEDEIVDTMEDIEIDEKEQEKELARDKLETGVSKLLGFVASIGLPKDIMSIKVNEYSAVAMETGVAGALIDTIEYYFPDVEMSPALVLLVSGVAFASAVMADRQQIKQKYKKQKGKKVEEIKKEKEDVVKNSAEV